MNYEWKTYKSSFIIIQFHVFAVFCNEVGKICDGFVQNMLGIGGALSGGYDVHR